MSVTTDYESYTDYNISTTTDDYDNYTDGYDDFCNLNPDPTEVIVQTCIHAIICTFGLIGNVLVMVTYIFYKKTKTMMDIYLCNLAVSDLIFAATLPLVMYNEQHGWSMGRVACKVLQSTYSINLYSGMLLLACISGDRYFAIVKATRSFGTHSRAVVYSRLICCGVWVLAAVLTLPTLIYTEPYKELGAVNVIVCELSFRKPETAGLIKLLVPSIQMAVGFLQPLCVMVFCYSCIMYTLLRAQSNERHKAIRVVFVVVVVFIVCHLPYNVTLLIHTLSLFKERPCDAELVKLKFLAIFKSVAYLHCCLNPFFYAFIGVRFRSHFWQIMLDLWCISKKYIYSTRSSRGTSDICISGPRTSDFSNNMSSFNA